MLPLAPILDDDDRDPHGGRGDGGADIRLDAEDLQFGRVEAERLESGATDAVPDQVGGECDSAPDRFPSRGEQGDAHPDEVPHQFLEEQRVEQAEFCHGDADRRALLFGRTAAGPSWTRQERAYSGRESARSQAVSFLAT